MEGGQLGEVGVEWEYASNGLAEMLHSLTSSVYGARTNSLRGIRVHIHLEGRHI